jgi:hypothetical protein
MTQLDLFPDDPVADHIKMMRLCWPEWDGPKVGGRCQVHSILAWSVTQNAERYHYMAPCEIIGEESGEWLGRIDYPENSRCAAIYNKEILRLPITNIWPPVRELVLSRKDAA